MVRLTTKILEQMLQDFLSVSDHFGILFLKWLNINCIPLSNYLFKVNNRNTRTRNVSIAHFEQVNAGWDNLKELCKDHPLDVEI